MGCLRETIREAPNLALLTPALEQQHLHQLFRIVPTQQKAAGLVEHVGPSSLCNNDRKRFSTVWGRCVGLGRSHAVGSDANLLAIYTYRQGQVKT